MVQHIAILRQPYVDLILARRKTVESRLTVNSIAPYRCVAPGDEIFFKVSCGPFLASALAKSVQFYERLTPARVDELKQQWNGRVCGDDAYWHMKRHSKFASFITLEKVQPIKTIPPFAGSSGLAWFMLSGHDEPARATHFDIELTAGAIRNGYIRVPAKLHQFPARCYGGRKIDEAGEPFELVMPDQAIVQTDIVTNHMIRWRGWKDYFRDQHMLPGNIVRFTREAPTRYRVSFVQRKK